MKVKPFVLMLTCIVPLLAQADIIVPMYATVAKGLGPLLGTVRINESPYGLEFQPHLKHLVPGYHGFHIQQNPFCANNALAAGAIFDPPTGSANEQLGGLPSLYVNADGTATTVVLAPRYQHLFEIKGRSLVIHEGGDDFASIDRKLGGGINQKVCGIIK